MRLLLIIITPLLFFVSAIAIPVTLSITGPMIRDIAMSGPGVPDLSYPKMIGKIGLGVAVASFVAAIGCAIACIIKSSNRERPFLCIFTALVVALIPCFFVMSGGPYNSAGDGGPNFFPLLVIAGGAVVAFPFLIWFIISLFFLKSKPKSPR